MEAFLFDSTFITDSPQLKKAGGLTPLAQPEGLIINRTGKI